MYSSMAYGQGYEAAYAARVPLGGYHDGNSQYHPDYSGQQESHIYSVGCQPASSFVQARTSQAPCKFFMHGKCTRGAECSFSHCIMQALTVIGNRDAAQEAQGQNYQELGSLLMLTLDDYSDFSDSDDEELLDDPMKRSEREDLQDSTLTRTLSTWSTRAPDVKLVGGASLRLDRGFSFDETSEDALTRTGSHTSDPWLADSGPETEEEALTPWAAQQQRKAVTALEAVPSPNDEQVARSIKSILNKLTMEKFDSLSKQLISCGLRSTTHMELLIRELFEKATTQHHFVDMYADLCTFLHKHFTDHPCVANAPDSKDKESKVISFKRLLLDECQAAFERRASLNKIDAEDDAAALRYKTRILGSVKLVGALLSRNMLAGKVGLIILEELLCSPTPESLECAALLLTTAGPALDNPDWNGHAALNLLFARIDEIVRCRHCKARERFLLKDLLDLRANNWVDKRPKKLERATTLRLVAEQASRSNQHSILRSLRA